MARVLIELSDAAGDAIENVADCITSQITVLDMLARNAGPSAHDDERFLASYQSLERSLRALRGIN